MGGIGNEEQFEQTINGRKKQTWKKLQPENLNNLNNTPGQDKVTMELVECMGPIANEYHHEYRTKLGKKKLYQKIGEQK